MVFESIEFESVIMICQHHKNVLNWENFSKNGVSEGIQKTFKHGHHVRRKNKGRYCG